MSKHAVNKQRHPVRVYLPWLMLAAGLVGLLLLVSRHPAVPERPAQQPAAVSTVPDTSSDSLLAGSEGTVVIPTGTPPSARPHPTVPRFVERISSDTTRLPLSLPVRMTLLDSISPTAPVEPIR